MLGVCKVALVSKNVCWWLSVYFLKDIFVKKNHKYSDFIFFPERMLRIVLTGCKNHPDLAGSIREELESCHLKVKCYQPASHILNIQEQIWFFCWLNDRHSTLSGVNQGRGTYVNVTEVIDGEQRWRCTFFKAVGWHLNMRKRYERVGL